MTRHICPSCGSDVDESAGGPPTTVERIRLRVNIIRAHAHDSEHAHALEDKLYAELLDAMSAGVVCRDDFEALAREARKSREIHFGRWMS